MLLEKSTVHQSPPRTTVYSNLLQNTWTTRTVRPHAGVGGDTRGGSGCMQMPINSHYGGSWYGDCGGGSGGCGGVGVSGGGGCGCGWYCSWW
jgi:hypothetical protein